MLVLVLQTMQTDTKHRQRGTLLGLSRTARIKCAHRVRSSGGRRRANGQPGSRRLHEPTGQICLPPERFRSLLTLSGGAALQSSVSGYAVCNGAYGDAPDSAGLSTEDQDRAAPASGGINHPETVAAVEELVRALLVQWRRRSCCAQRPADTANTRRGRGGFAPTSSVMLFRATVLVGAIFQFSLLSFLFFFYLPPNGNGRSNLVLETSQNITEVQR